MEKVNVLFLLTVAASVWAAPPIDNPLMAQDYLMRYNYIDQSDMGDGKMMSEDLMKQGIMKFQWFANLTMTGELDNATMAKMNMPRCGVPDMMFNMDAKRKKRYSADASWGRTDLTYRIDSVTPDMPQATAESIITQAFEYWAQVSALTFTRVYGTTDADILISFASFSHGDGNPFDGPSGTLAHAYFPNVGIGGDAHFDESETWDEAGNGINLLQVAIHEFGHSLGLGHSEVNSAIMAPFYPGYIPNIQLDADDIAGIQYLYGVNSGNPDVTMPPPDPEETQPPNAPCNGNFDAITTTADGSTYAFQGSYAYKLTNTGIEETYPRLISQEFAGLPDNIDAAIFWEDVGKTYIFKGDQYWRLTNTAVDTGYPRSISLWNGLPSDMDAAFVWSGNNRYYFVKGDQYWRYNRFTGRVDNGYPRPLSVWRGLPTSGLNAAFQFTNSRTYFFYNDGQYYRFNDRQFRVDSSYPRSTVEWWLGCASANIEQLGTTPSSGAGMIFYPSFVTLMTSFVLSLASYISP